LQWALGDKVKAAYGDVPFIFKVLSIAQALSIQVCAVCITPPGHAKRGSVHACAVAWHCARPILIIRV
jgi:hypothetical protein